MRNHPIRSNAATPIRMTAGSTARGGRGLAAATVPRTRPGVKLGTSQQQSEPTAVSQLDIKSLEANFEGWRTERAPKLPVSEAFERFAVEQVLKDADLSDDEIQSGNFGGKDDGGVDAMYFFVNNALI